MRRLRTLRLTPTRIAYILATAIAVLLLILLGSTRRREQATAELEIQINAIENNLAGLQNLKEDTLESLRTDLQFAQAHTSELERSFPDLGAPIALYPTAFDLATQDNVELLQVDRRGKEPQETVIGVLSHERYGIHGTGTAQACLSFMSDLEDLGIKTVTVNDIAINVSEGDCSFEVLTVGFADGAPDSSAGE